MPASVRQAAASRASRPSGASRAATSESGVASPIFSTEEALDAADVLRQPREDAAEPDQRRADADALRLAQLVLADGLLVRAAPLLHDGDGLAHPPLGLEEAQQDHGVCDVA